MSGRAIVALACLGWVLVAGGCARPVMYPLTNEPAYTQTNLHAPQEGNRLFSVNYYDDQLIPICTAVQIEQVTTELMVFTRLDNGEKYQYVFHRSMREDPQTHLDKYFDKSCPEDKLAKLSPNDQKGVEEGKVIEGMTKQGVVLAIGYPPTHRTPSLQADVWTYWHADSGQFQVHFEDGRVANVGYP